MAGRIRVSPGLWAVSGVGLAGRWSVGGVTIEARRLVGLGR